MLTNNGTIAQKLNSAKHMYVLVSLNSYFNGMRFDNLGEAIAKAKICQEKQKTVCDVKSITTGKTHIVR